MSPKGVSTPQTAARHRSQDRECIHQCRRKALSTGRETPAPTCRLVHSSMSPKGVEHLVAVTEASDPSCRVHSSMSPKGVEHPSPRRQIRPVVCIPMSPKGVEHPDAPPVLLVDLSVHSSMSPKGVEHQVEGAKAQLELQCIHQCRRKALSTRLGTHRCSPRCVHSSMSPKGVEHFSAYGTPQAVLSTVHSSMSPKGVEHTLNAPCARLISCAFINVAERRWSTGHSAARPWPACRGAFINVAERR